MRRFFKVCMLLLAGGATAYGYTNILENGTNITINSGWDAGGNMIVGGTTAGNELFIASGGSLTNVNAFVGEQAGASDNSAEVSGSDAEWINTGTLTVGATDNSNNVVSVGSGGTVSAGDLAVAAGNDFNLRNDGTLILTNGFDVSTAGFNWDEGGTLSVGGELTGMAVTNEGTILAGEKTLVLNGGKMTSATDFILGYEDSDNVLMLTNGATAGNADGYIGWGADAENNTVLVAGSGSTWTNEGNLYIGVYGTNQLASGSGNGLTVTNGGWVLVGGLDTSLTAMGSGGVTVAGGAEAVVGENEYVFADGVYIDPTGSFDLDGTLTVNGDFDADQTGFNWNDGSTLAVRQELTYNNTFDGTNKTLGIDGGSWNRGGDLQLDGSGNVLVVVNGGGVTNDDAFVTGADNRVVVSDQASSWQNNGVLNIIDSGNDVTVTNGGRITADTLNVEDGNEFNLSNGGTLAMTGGFDVSAHSNLNWNAGGNLAVGGLLEGMAVESNLSIADAEYLSGRKELTLEGGRWLMETNNLIVGFNDDLSRLAITNGGTATSANGYIGWGDSGDLNEVVVQSGGTWANNGGGLYVGMYHDSGTNLVQAGQENSLAVEDGGWVYVGEGRIAGPAGGMVVASTNGAELVVGGEQSSVNVAQTLYVGVDAVTTGSVLVADGGAVSADALEIAANSTFDLYGSLAVSNGFNAGQNGFEWYDEALLSVGGDLTGIDSLSGTNRTLVINGGTWDTSAITNLYITGVGNTLAITNGGVVDNASAFIGSSTNDVDNTVLVDDSQWNLSGDLQVNAGNSLRMASNGLVSIDGNMTVSNATVAGSGTVVFGAGDNILSFIGESSQLSTNVLFDGGGGADTVAVTDAELAFTDSTTNWFSGFENLNMTNSLLSATGALDLFDTISLSGGRLAPDGDMVIDGIFSASDTTLEMTAGLDTLTFTNSGGVVNLSGMTAEVSVSNNVAPGDLITNSLALLTSATGFDAAGFADTNIVEYFLLYDFILTNDATTVSVTSEAAQDGEISASVAYSGIQGIRSGFNRMQNAIFSRTKQLRRNAVATDYAVSNDAFIIPVTNAPAGPQGPGDRNTIFGMHFWAEQFSGQGDYDAVGMSDGFVLNNNGTTFGLDRLFGDSLVAGIGYTYVRTAAKSTSNDRVDTETYWLGLYGEWFGWDEFYVNGMIGLGKTDYSSIRREDIYEGNGRYGGNNIGGHIEAGRYFHRNNWALAPYAGLQYLGIESDAYTEVDSTDGNEVHVSGQSVASLDAALGVKLRNRFDTDIGRFQTVGYAEWAYDFIKDSVESTLSGDGVTVKTARITPGESGVNAGLGLSWVCTDYLEIGAGYDGRFSEDYEEHIGSAMLEVRF